MSYHFVAKLKGGHTNQKVLESDLHSPRLLLGIDASRLPSQLSGNWIDRNVVNEVIDELSALDRLLGFSGAPDPVLEFHDADHRKSNLIGSGQLADINQ